MATSSAILGNGTTLHISSGSPTSYSLVGNVHDITWDDGTNPEVEVTNLASTSKEFLPGFADAGTFTASLDLDMGDAGQAVIQAAKLSRIACDIKITLPSGTTPTWTARGYVKKFGKSLGVDGAVRASLEFRVTGQWSAA